MAARAVDSLRVVSDPVVLLGDDGTLGERLAVPWRADERPGRGPLGGLATGLRWAAELGRRGLLVLACDLPLVTREAMESVMAVTRPGVDAVVATDAAGGLQPLCAWYATSALRAVEDALEHGRYSVRELVSDLSFECVTLGGGGGGPDAALLNVNTPGDHAEAVRYTRRENDR